MPTLADIREGDEVAIYTGRGRSLRRVHAGRCTKTRIYVFDKQYLRSNGRLVGTKSDLWHGPYEWIEAWDNSKHPDEETQLLKEIKLAKSRNILVNFSWKSVTQEQADAVISVLKRLGLTLL